MKRGVSMICVACPGRLLFLSWIAPIPPLHSVQYLAVCMYSIEHNTVYTIQCSVFSEGAWAIFPWMRCEASPASPYVNTVRPDSAFMIKNANLAFHRP